MLFPSDLLDEINLRITDILIRNASRPFVEIAKELEISDATVHMRVRRLVAAGIIRKFTIATDDRLLGYHHLAFMGINIKEGSADEAAARLSKARRDSGDTRNTRPVRFALEDTGKEP